MSYVVDGMVHFTREARFVMPGWDSPDGEFRIGHMNSDTVSKIFGERTPMPYAIFYQGNVAIHNSQDFADKGYEGARTVAASCATTRSSSGSMSSSRTGTGWWSIDCGGVE